MAEQRRAGFRRISRSTAAAASPRSLFRDLPRDPDVPFLWGHQDRILEGYEAHVDVSDLALELPTGTGKTLIGLLIAEWRRRSEGERVLYLCPTRQLAHQVGALADRYGIDVAVSLRPDYAGLDRWQNGDVLAVSTYSALFNYRPRFTAPQALVLDDAHAAEGYVAGHWTVSVDRREMPDAHRALAELLAPLLDRRIAGALRDDDPRPIDRSAVEMVPLPRWWPQADELRELLDEAVEDTDQWYAWTDHVRDGLAACCLLVSWREIVLRPLVPATARQREFADAAQRVYMSATLGSGGELERIFGVRRIRRLPAPEEWERRSTGRRLFLLPAASVRQDQLDEVVGSAVQAAGRALVLAPTRDAVEHRQQQLAGLGMPTLGASDIEESLEPFTSRERAALLLANRYDGLDLPGDDCRLMVLDGLPVAVNLLERFFFQRLTATDLLRERMRTRLTQGVGRATRGEGDWCAVMVGSREAYDFCARGEVRALLHPELQGELRFGLEQSADRNAQDFLELLQALLDHGEEWEEAEAQIRQLRDEATRQVDPAAAALEAVVADEVGFTYAMYDGNYPSALERAQAVADGLGGEEAAPYRGFWLYLAGAAAWMAHERFAMPDMLTAAHDLFRRAAATGSSVHWFAELAYSQVGGDAERDVSAEDLQAAERAQALLRHIGFHGSGFQRRAATLRRRLNGTAAGDWEEGLKQLGGLLGFDASRPSGQNTPDSVWVASERLAFVWEAKSEEDPNGAVGARTAQQASGHVAWARQHRPLANDALVLPLLVSDRTRLGDGADVHAGEVRVVRLDEVRALAQQASAALARARTLGERADDMRVRTKLLDELRTASLLPSQLTDRLGARRLSDLSG